MAIGVRWVLIERGAGHRKVRAEVVKIEIEDAERDEEMNCAEDRAPSGVGVLYERSLSMRTLPSGGAVDGIGKPM